MLTAEATRAKRKEIAANIRADAAQLPAGTNEAMLRLAESLVYEKNTTVQRQFEKWADKFANEVKALSPTQLERRKGEIVPVLNAVKYLAKFDVLSPRFSALVTLERIEKSQGWEKKKKK